MAERLTESALQLSDKDILNRIVENLLEAGVITPASVNSTTNKLSGLSRTDLFIWLIESHDCLEMVSTINLQLN
jgi:hypothetical protein